MNLYWFSDEDGHYWSVIVAKDATRAWQKLAECQCSDSSEGIEPGISVKEAKKQFVLNARTGIDGKTEGKVASIFPLECGFTILKTPGGELSMLANH